MKRRHVRTRQTKINFSKGLPNGKTLTPGVYRVFHNEGEYYASFIVNKDRTVEFYGAKLVIEEDDGWAV